MINERKEAQSEIEVVMLEELVPQDHLLRWCSDERFNTRL